jgi:imidazole glycerol phosphate synthase subunit HisF
MAKIPLPERGQPIDVSYLYQMSNAINQLSDQVTSTGYNYTTIDTPAAGKQNVRTADARVIGGQVIVTSNSSQTADSTKTFSYSYNGNFKYTPIATATVVNTSGGAGDAATVVLTSVDANGLNGLVRFDKAGNASTIVNLIIVGIPN